MKLYLENILMKTEEAFKKTVALLSGSETFVHYTVQIYSPVGS